MDTDDDTLPLEPTERLVRGVVMDNRSHAIMNESNDALDELAARVIMSVMKAADAGPLTASFAIEAWYQYVTIMRLRKSLEKRFKKTAFVGKR